MIDDGPNRRTNVSDLGRSLFRFAVVSDTHVNPRDDHTEAPWPSFAKANARAIQAVANINAANPAFVVHLGDQVNPTPALTGYQASVQRFHDIFQSLTAPLYTVPGNHDVGDKPLAWMPAKMVQQPFLEAYRKGFGEDYRSFTFGACRFFLINAQLLNSGLPQEQSQRVWLERQLAEDTLERRFLFCHYPPFILDPEEDGHYDNIDQPARSWLLELIATYRIEAVFSGHVHNLFYNRVGRTDFYTLPSTAFVRSDFSEMFRVTPPGDCGRDDDAKLGWMLIEVHEKGHVSHFVRLNGAGARQAGAFGKLIHPKKPTARSMRVGVDMRQPWAEVVEIPYNGVVDEFARKYARNDYLVQALAELGIGRLRVPVQDLTNEATRLRMAALSEIGFTFGVFSYGIPTQATRTIAASVSELLTHWEMIDTIDRLEASESDRADFRESLACPLFVSPLWTAKDAKATFKLSINHGFRISGDSQLDAFISSERVTKSTDGLVFRIGWDDQPAKALATIRAMCDTTSMSAIAHLRLADDYPSTPRCDEGANIARLLEAAEAAERYEIAIYLDTITDVDRASFPRAGLVDRLFNIRRTGVALRNAFEASDLIRPQASQKRQVLT